MPSQKQPVLMLCIIGTLLSSYQIFIRLISARFDYSIELSNTPILTFVAAQALAGAVFLLLIPTISRLQSRTSLFVLMLIVGVLFRALMFGSTPILEVDFYRYLWDGGLLANGHNPYAIPPAGAITADNPDIRAIAIINETIVSRINYPELRSIYPPVSQLAFLVAHWIGPWSLDTWRLVALIFDCTSVFLIVQLLRVANKSPMWAILYWWNPLVIKELFNSAHTEVILLPILLAGVLSLARNQSMRAVAAIALASGVKLWPIILTPLALFRLRRHPRALITCLLVLSALLMIFVMPLFIFGLGDHSGLGNYAQQWERNSSAFLLIKSVVDNLLVIDAGTTARLIVALFIAVFAFVLATRRLPDASAKIHAVIVLIAALFLLSPTQFPWYFTWLAPLLCVYPIRALLLLTPLLSLYYLRFYFDARGQAEFFDNVIVWIQFVPVWVLLAYDRFRSPNTLNTPDYV